MRSRILAAALTVAFGLLSIGPALAAGGQFGNLNGTVIDATSRAPIAGAAVSAKSGSGEYSAKTDGAGHFTILGMNVDSYTVTVTANGYEPVNVPNVVVFGDETDTTGNISMTKQLQQIAHVTSRSVSSAYQPSQTIDSYTVNQQQMLQTTGKAANTNENSVLLSVPGVTMTNAGNVTIRGGAEYEVGYQYDGVNFKDPFLGMNGAGLTGGGLVNGVGSVQVVEGAGDATQGGVGAGVINVIPERGSGPGSGEVDLESGGPNFSHQFAFDYGFSTPDNRISEYIAFNGQRLAPYNGYATTPLNQYGNFFATAYQSNNQFTNNFFFNFGKNNHETLQVLYTNISSIGWQGNGAVGTAYYPYDDTTAFASGGAFGVGVGALSGLNPSQYAALIGLTPGTPAVDVSPSGNQQNFSNNTDFLKLEYDNRINPTTYFDLRYYNWAGLADTDSTYSLGAPEAGIFGAGAGQVRTGGYTAGFSSDLEKQFGENLTVSLEGQYNFLHPLFDDYSPDDTIFAPLFTGLNDPVGACQWTANNCGAANGNYGNEGYFCETLFNCNNALGVADARLPVWGINYQKTVFQNWGAGLRFQYAATDNLKFDLGVRDEGQNQHWNGLLSNMDLPQVPASGYQVLGLSASQAAAYPNCSEANYSSCPTASINNPYDVASTSWTNNVLHPTELQPRVSVSYQMNRWNSFRFGYGRSAVFQNAQNGGTPFQLYGDLSPYAKIAPYAPNGGTALCGWTATVVFACQNALQQIYWQGDNVEAPDAGNGRPALYNNYDLSWNHLFKNGWGTRITPFIKVGQTLPAGFYLNPVLGIFAVGNQGYNKTTGGELNITTPQTHFGLSGFFTATYQNVLSTTPPFTLDETEVPTVPNASLGLGDLYRAGYVSPFSIRIGGLENLKNGITVSPQLQYNIGYPYSVGNMIAATLANGSYANIPQVDFGPGITGGLSSLIGSAPGAAVGTNYYDPADPGTAFHPNIDATRGTPGTSANGGYLSHPNLTGDLTVQWKHGPNTIGVQMLNLFGNAFVGSVPAINPWYQPVANGVSGPQTGYNSCGGQVGAGVRGCYPYTAKDIYAFNNGAYLLTNGNFTAGSVLAPLQPFSFQVYFQRSL
jgi:hypothetical protein